MNSSNSSNSFTLVELLIAITLAVFLGGAIYWGLATGLESWGYLKDELALEKFASETMQKLTEGPPDGYGLRDGLEVAAASPYEVEMVFPWTDDTHTVHSGVNVYTLNRQLKAASAMPLAEARLPESEEYRPVPAAFLDWGRKEELNKMRLLLEIPAGSALRFIYHPDIKKNPDVSAKFKWVKEEGQIYREDYSGERPISRNPFGIKITQFSFRYYDSANKELSDGAGVNEDNLRNISGIEVYLEASFRNKKKELMSFVNLRNSFSRGGAAALKEGMKINIPDSKRIKTLFITNLMGIDNQDALQLEARASGGRSWRITVNFSRQGLAVPLIESYTIEYPAGQVIFTASPRTSVELGLNLLSVGINGLQDYDDDEEVEDLALLEGEAQLEVTRMDIAGAAIFVRP